MYTITLSEYNTNNIAEINYSYIILKPSAPSSSSISVKPDYLTARTNLGTQEFRENNKVNSGSVMGLV